MTQHAHTNDIEPHETEGVARRVAVLNMLLADEFGIFTKTLNYHWNVVGPRFHSIHEFLEDQYRSLLEMMDDVAERARMLGGPATGTVRELLKTMHLNETAGAQISANEMLADLAENHRKIQDEIHHFLGSVEWKSDPGTEDFLVGILKKHEKMTWMLQAHLE